MQWSYPSDCPWVFFHRNWEPMCVYSALRVKQIIADTSLWYWFYLLHFLLKNLKRIRWIKNIHTKFHCLDHLIRSTNPWEKSWLVLRDFVLMKKEIKLLKKGSKTPSRKIIIVEAPWASMNDKYERYIRSHYTCWTFPSGPTFIELLKHKK